MGRTHVKDRLRLHVPAGTGSARRLISPAAGPQRPAGSTTPGRRPLPGVPELTWRLSLGSSAPPHPSAVCLVSVVPSPLGRGRCETRPSRAGRRGTDDAGRPERRRRRTSAWKLSSAVARACGWVPALRSAAAGMTGAGGAPVSLAQPGVRRGQQAVDPPIGAPGVSTPPAHDAPAGCAASPAL